MVEKTLLNKESLIEKSIFSLIIVGFFLFLMYMVAAIFDYFDPDISERNIQLNGQNVKLLQLQNETWIHCIKCEIVE